MLGCLGSDWLQMASLGCEHLAVTDETASPAPPSPTQPPRHCSWAARFAHCEMGGHLHQE